MFGLPYETTICSPHNPERLTLALKRANIEYPFPTVTTPAGNVLERAVFITPRDEHHDVPPVTQFLNIGTAEAPTLVIDGRPYMRFDQRNDSYNFTAANDYSFLCTRVALTLTAMSEGTPVLGRLGDVPVKTFVRWISQALGSKYVLPLEQQLTLMVLTAYYYYGLVDPLTTEDEDARNRLAPMVARVTGAPTAAVLTLATRIQEPAKTADEFAKQIATVSGSLRFGEFKFIDLWTILANHWAGVASRENIGVALEHVPTWIAMVYAALGERSYRRTIITQRAETAGRPTERDQFVRQVERLVSEQFAG